MLGSYFRRFCFLLVAFALIGGLPLYGSQSSFAAAPAALPCGDCECCGDEGIINASACAMICASTKATPPEVEAFYVTESNGLFSEAALRHAGLSTAPDPSPPRLFLLT
jgi:hypothetical protein